MGIEELTAIEGALRTILPPSNPKVSEIEMRCKTFACMRMLLKVPETFGKMVHSAAPQASSSNYCLYGGGGAYNSVILFSFPNPPPFVILDAAWRFAVVC